MPKIGRNDPCPCGSGRKYKKCCMSESVIAEKQPNALRQGVSFPGIVPVQLSPSSPSKESALYDVFDEIVELERADRVGEAARKFLRATADIQELPDDFYWDVGKIGFSIASSCFLYPNFRTSIRKPLRSSSS